MVRQTARRRVMILRSMRRAMLSTALALPFTSLAQNAPVPPRAAGDVHWAHITYIAGPSIYLDAGSTNGLREGSRLDVVRDSATVAELVVQYISSTRAACTVTHSDVDLRVGDSARYVAVVTAPNASSSAPAQGSAGAIATRSVAYRPRPLRGRLGMRYMTLNPGNGAGTMTQPALDLRLDGHHLGDSPLGLVVDVRAHRMHLAAPTAVAGASGRTESATRVYQAALQWEQGPAHIAIGRQFSTAISPVGLFDGVATDFNWRRWATGAFTGSQPDPVSFGYSGDVRDYGAWLQLHNVAGSGAPWSITTGAIGSYAGGEIDREYLYLQGMLSSRHFSLLAAQELDFNRGWKSDVEKSATTPTSTYISARVAITDGFSLQGGMDNRRSVRLYRDYVNPEVAFDDSFRQGAWGGASAWLLGHVRASADARVSSGGSAGRVTSHTYSLGVERLTRLGLGFRGRATDYNGDAAAGRLFSGAIELHPASALRLEVSRGIREDAHPLAGLGAARLHWFGADADVSLTRSLYLLLSTYREQGDLGRSTQSYAAFSIRF